MKARMNNIGSYHIDEGCNGILITRSSVDNTMMEETVYSTISGKEEQTEMSISSA